MTQLHLRASNARSYTIFCLLKGLGPLIDNFALIKVKDNRANSFPYNVQTDKTIKEFRENLLTLKSNDFEAFCVEVFRFQVKHNPVYQTYVGHLKVDAHQVRSLQDIPFLPIEFFKSQEIKTGQWNTSMIFKSSGTTGMSRSQHMVDDIDFYRSHTVNIFEHFYGNPSEWEVIALLPSYQEQGHSSLIAMVDHFINLSDSPQSGYYKPKSEALHDLLSQNIGQKRLLIGVTYALMDMAEEGRVISPGTVVMETGGMKGRRREITRFELHNVLKSGLGVDAIHSEYGMTELFSQAYAMADGEFEPAPTMKILIRDINDPFAYLEPEITGAINMVDLANIHSCAFIETKDIGRKTGEENFQVLGRMDNSDIRGCSLLY